MTATDPIVERDTAGGASIRGFQGSELIIDEPDVFALDVIDAPNLASIRIRTLNKPKRPHLVLSNVPQLRELTLPSGHPGAIVHLNADVSPLPFTMSGAVSEIDAAWPGIQFRSESAPGHHHWSRVLLCLPSLKLPEPAGQGLVIVTGPLHDDLDQLTLGAGNDWLLTDIPGLRHVQSNTSGQVSMDQLPHLSTVNSSGHGLQLSLSGVPRLSRISGRGDTVSVRQSKWDKSELVIAEHWKHAKIASDYLEALSFSNGESLTLHHCRKLRRVDLPLGMDVVCHGALPAPLAQSARFFFDEATLSASMDVIRQGDIEALPSVLQILANAHEPAQAVQCLVNLQSLCELDLDAGQIWQTRRELAARHRTARSRKNTRSLRPLNGAAIAKADLYWHWRFPEDLAHQGWEADLEIWRYCQDKVPAARDYGDVIALTCQDAAALDVLIRQAGSHRSYQFARLAIHAMHGYLSQKSDYLLDRQRAGNNDPTRRLIRILNRPDLAEDQRRTIVEFLCNTLPVDTLLQSLPPVMHLAVGPFRSQVMAISRKPERWFIARMANLPYHRRKRRVEHYRSRFLRLALAPVSQDEENGKAHESATTGANYSLFEEDA